MNLLYKQIKIIITDDQLLFRNGVRNSLIDKKDISIIGEAVNGVDLLDKLEYLKPDIIILNISMPVMDGPTTLPILKKKYPGIKVIILSMHNDNAMICRMIELGASTYLTKESGSEKIYEAILACHKSWFFINDTVRNALRPSIVNKTSALSFDLSEKELKIITLLRADKTTKEIGDEVDLSPRTVKAIIDKIKAKAGVRSKAGLILFCVRKKMIE